MANGYTPDPLNVDRPVLGDLTQIPAELRGIKGQMQTDREAAQSKITPSTIMHPAGSAIATMSGNHTINLENGTYFKRRPTAATTLSFTVPEGQANNEVYFFTLLLQNGGTQDITWPTSLWWSRGIVPVFTTAGYDVLTFFQRWPGDSWVGNIAMADIKVPE